MIVARISVEGGSRDLGDWQFAALPRVGEAIAIPLGETPLFAVVTGVVHAPVLSDEEDYSPLVTIAVQLQLSN